ncbi:ATP-binding cassette domain-containing protein [Streptomyces sp. NPDC051976]|uniref:ABC transporter ATP-binding protein n=1 Tax=Streptomyces sp. NPDC051976 TaxID=3154947 RepID=UPI00342D1A8F
MIEATSLTKRYGDKAAVEDLTFTVRPGIVTGFLGPNGAGKSTTMRLILGMDAPSSGSVTVNGLPFAQHPRPLKTVGALLEARAIHPGRSARGHLLAQAATAGITRQRVDEVIGMVGLDEAAGRRAGRFSLGMGQRLGIASALLADPEILILDEPVNGLDPDGIRWIRLLLRELASEGRTVLLSSHLMSEMALTADHVIVMGRGRLLRDQSMASFIADAGAERVRVRSPEAGTLRELLVREGASIHETGEPGTTFEVEGLTSEDIGTAARRAGVTLYELAPMTGSLEEAYMALTQDAVEFRTKEAA